MKMGIALGIVALVIAITSATNFFIQETNNIEQVNNEISTNENVVEDNSNIIVNSNVSGNKETENVEIIKVNNTVVPSDSVGIINIPKISLNAAVRDGHSLEVLKKSLGHFDGTAYWQGNIGILGHNSGSAGYFKNLTQLVVGDKINYTTEYGTRTYQVAKITQIDDTDWSMLANTTDNRITLITCVKGVPEKRLCIQANEI